MSMEIVATIALLGAFTGAVLSVGAIFMVAQSNKLRNKQLAVKRKPISTSVSVARAYARLLVLDDALTEMVKIGDGDWSKTFHTYRDIVRKALNDLIGEEQDV